MQLKWAFARILWVLAVCVPFFGAVLYPAEVSAFVTGREATVLVSELPKQGQSTYKLILNGGPFPYEKDGVVFGNRERLLPKQPRGYYREYTVPTPGSRDRGARRIVCGGNKPAQPQVCYYTDDHYASFRKIDAVR
ncbi:MAG: hypothetical protein RLZZ271_481 [Pseudomonadota bacterium]|jgi:ribonuclease T1